MVVLLDDLATVPVTRPQLVVLDYGKDIDVDDEGEHEHAHDES
jgi:hypothetical protein